MRMHPKILRAKQKKELQNFVDGWCKRCGVGTTYYKSHKYKVRIPWEEYKGSDRMAVDNWNRRDTPKK